jgi:hypothetical protein
VYFVDGAMGNTRIHCNAVLRRVLGLGRAQGGFQRELATAMGIGDFDTIHPRLN